MSFKDLRERYDDFLKVKPAIDKLYQLKLKELNLMNQPIYFRNLVLRTDGTYGEVRGRSSKCTQSTKERLKAHIQFIFKLVQEDHRANYCTQDKTKLPEISYMLKEGYENHITRLTMHEFSLYTEKPLILNEYSQLIKDIHAMAEQLEPNIHVLLSSIAVIDAVAIAVAVVVAIVVAVVVAVAVGIDVDVAVVIAVAAVNDVDKLGKLLNMSLYVQGGKFPLVHHFAKNTPSSLDVTYDGMYIPFSQSEYEYDTVEFIFPQTHAPIYMGSVFDVKTWGGAVYTQAVDVCFDHAIGHSQNQMERRLLKNAAANTLLPIQVEHCVSSHSIRLNPNNAIADKMLQADPKISIFSSKYHQYREILGNKTLTDESKKKILPSDYPQMSIKENGSGYKIGKPPFGGTYVIEVSAERPAAKACSKYHNAINRHNANFITAQLIASRQIKFKKEDPLIQAIALHSSRELQQTIFASRHLFSKLFKYYEDGCVIDSKFLGQGVNSYTKAIRREIVPVQKNASTTGQFGFFVLPNKVAEAEQPKNVLPMMVSS